MSLQRRAWLALVVALACAVTIVTTAIEWTEATSVSDQHPVAGALPPRDSTHESKAPATESPSTQGSKAPATESPMPWTLAGSSRVDEELDGNPLARVSFVQCSSNGLPDGRYELIVRQGDPQQVLACNAVSVDGGVATGCLPEGVTSAVIHGEGLGNRPISIETENLTGHGHTAGSRPCTIGDPLPMMLLWGTCSKMPDSRDRILVWGCGQGTEVSEDGTFFTYVEDMEPCDLTLALWNHEDAPTTTVHVNPTPGERHMEMDCPLPPPSSP